MPDSARTLEDLSPDLCSFAVPHRMCGAPKQLRRAVGEEKFPVSGEALAVSMSVGAVAWQVCETAPALESILSCADAALYRAKNGGRNRVVIGDPTVVGGIA